MVRQEFRGWIAALTASCFFAASAGCSHPTPKPTDATIKDLEGLWVSNDLYLKLEAHPETDDEDDTLPVMRIRGDKFCMVDNKIVLTGDVLLLQGRFQLAPDQMQGLTQSEVAQKVGLRDALEALKREDLTFDRASEMLTLNDPDYHRPGADPSAQPEALHIRFRLLGSGLPAGADQAKGELPLVGDWQAKVPSEMSTPGKSLDDRIENASTDGDLQTKGIYLAKNGAYAMETGELIEGTWRRQGKSLVLKQEKCSSQKSLAPEITFDISADSKTLAWVEKGKTLFQFVRY